MFIDSAAIEIRNTILFFLQKIHRCNIKKKKLINNINKIINKNGSLWC